MKTHVVVSSALLAASALLFGPTEARAGDWGFGVIPGLRLGPNFGTLPGMTESRHGWLGEAHIDVIFAGPTVGVGTSFGYVYQGIAHPDESKIGMGFNGFTLTPMLMIAPFSRLILIGKGGPVFGSISNGLADDVDTTGWRGGGQLMIVIARNAGADITLGLDFLHTAATGQYPTGDSVAYQANAVTLDMTCSFDYDALDL